MTEVAVFCPGILPRPQPGRTMSTEHPMLQKYRILGKKGEGSFAEVMACQNVRDGHLYACKRLKKHFPSVEQALRLTEVRALRRLGSHANIVQLYDIIYDKRSGRLALIFELMDLNMHELLKARRRPLPEFRVKNYMYQLLKSLDHIHRHGIFHRDIKPENLLIRDNVLKLADFGSCRGIYTRPPYTEYISTRWYRPPECLLTSGYYSYKMDMWAAGCVLFEALTNRPLFPGSSEIDQIAKIHTVLGTPKPHILAKLRRHRKSLRLEFAFQPGSGTGIATLSSDASNDAHNLLTHLCAYDEEERPTAREALRHPYFSDIRLAERYQKSRKRMTTSKSLSKKSPVKENKHLASLLPISSLSPRSETASNTSQETKGQKKKKKAGNNFLPQLEAPNPSGAQQSKEAIENQKQEADRPSFTVRLPNLLTDTANRRPHQQVPPGSHVGQLPLIHKPWRP